MSCGPHSLSHGIRLAALPALIILAAGTAAFGATPLTTTRVAFGLDRPLYLTAPPGDTARAFILEQYTGAIRILDLASGTLKPTPFMTQTGLAMGGEQGLLGMAFHPDYANNGYFYLHYTRVPDGAIVIKRYTVSANPDIADTSMGTPILIIPKPTGGTNHNAGWVAFGPDGYFYVTVGDGGNSPGYYAQDDSTRYGKILRLDVDAAFPYAIPADNPFAGAPSPKNEFWVKGLRNPWRCSFDRVTGDLMIADVGAGLWEEIDFQPDSSGGGENYGWNKFEGFVKYICPDPCDSSGLTRPIHVYDHSSGCSITGGYVYRGSKIPGLQGTYFFADYCSWQIWSLRVVNGVATEVTDRTAELDPIGPLTIIWPSSFGEDARGEIYICDHVQGNVFRIIAYPTGVGSSAAGRRAVVLSAPFPNPSAGGFRFRVEFAAEGSARVRVFDSAGRLVRRLTDARFGAGPHWLAWDGHDDRGARVPSGAYLLRVESESGAFARKAQVIR